MPSALFKKTVEIFFVIGLPDALSTFLLYVKYKRETVNTLWKKNIFYDRIFSNLKHNIIFLLGDKQFNFLAKFLKSKKDKILCFSCSPLNTLLLHKRRCSLSQYGLFSYRKFLPF
jgi:hypothetical protein